MLRIRVPASAGNVGSGFDVLGLALRLYLRVDVKKQNDGRCETHFTGEGFDVINQTNNLIESSMKRVLKMHDVKNPGVSFRVRNEIPVQRGLGSSGTAIVAGVIAADYIGNLNLTKREMLSLAVRLEGPPDNVNSSFAGGLTSSLVLGQGMTEYRKCRFPSVLSLVYAVPDFQVSTKMARKILPKKYPVRDVIYNMQRVALVFEAVRTRDYDLLSLVLKDRIHQDYRAALVPGISEILKLPAGNGLICTYISGSGPSVGAVVTGNEEETAARMKAAFAAHDISARTMTLKADNTGTVYKEIE